MPPKKSVFVPHKKVLASGEKIQAIVRVRPPLPSESQSLALNIDSNLQKVEGYQFDRVHGPSSLQSSIFKESILPIIDAWVDGYNACIFAYGQTGSGKTHTMLGEDGGKKKLDGVIPQAVAYALQRIQEEEEACLALTGNPSEFRIQASYIELYLEELRDLLGNDNDKGKVSVREDTNGVVFVDGAEKHTIHSPSDVIKLVQLGSQRRATGRTNMNEHSSRSHAIFSLCIDHRWRDEECVASGNSRLFRMQSSVINMVDLAGSEYAKKTGNTGERLQESIAINSGLFALGNVIAALAGHRDRRVGNHIPYRDSILTRLLQSSLGGDAKTLMVACVGPAVENTEESLSTLSYAASTRCIENAAKLQIQDIEAEAKPLDNDVADPEPELDRRSIWIDTVGYGDVFARAIGDERDELILFVHGSGPSNSSLWWNNIIYDIVTRSPIPYYMVAIDCPGYGRSPGDKQTIRSYPGAFLQDVVCSLGKGHATCLVGSSQGACAVFNATLECPSITKHLAVMDPVGHDVFRYKAIAQPCLLTFDVEDEGHPVKVGRWMKDNLPNNAYFEFAGSKEPYWHSDHFANELIKMLLETRYAPGKSANVLSSMGKSLARLAGGLFSWAEWGGYGAPLKTLNLLEPPSKVMPLQLGEDMVRQLTVSSSDENSQIYTGNEPVGTKWVMEQDKKTGRVYYFCEETMELVYRRPKNGIVVNESTKATATITTTSSKKTTEKKEKELFVDPDQRNSPKPETAKEKEERLQEERQALECIVCQEMLWEPRRMEKCRHVICGCCFLAAQKYSGLCPVCLVTTKAEPVDPDHQQLLLAAAGPQKSAELQIKIDARKQLSDSTLRVIIEYGNTASGQPGSAYAVEAFAKVAKVERGSKFPGKELSATRLLERVDFNINPHYPQSAVKVTSPPFTLQRTMALQFTCEMTLHFTSSSDIPPIIIPYYIHHEQKYLRRLVLYLGVPSSMSERKKITRKSRGIEVDPDTSIEVFL